MKKLLIFATFLSHAAFANVFGKDDRRSFTPSEKPWTAIGKLEINKTGVCTGTLFSPTHVITAAHCVVENGEIVPLRHVVFKPAFKFGKSEHYSWATEITVGSLEPTKEFWKDWAIIKLAHPLGNLYGTLVPLTLIREKNNASTRVALVGYSADWMQALSGSFQNECYVREVKEIGYTGRNRLFYHDCDMHGGASGGPIIQWIGNQPFIAAINVAESLNPLTRQPYVDGIPYTTSSANIAAPVSEAIRKSLESAK